MYSMFTNESNIYEEKIKSYFKNNYKNLNISILSDVINDFVKGYYITVIELTLEERETQYISFSKVDNIEDLTILVKNTIDNLVQKIIKKHFYK